MSVNQIAAIEFDTSKYGNNLDISAWFNQNPVYNDLRKLKGFRLRQVARSLFMSDEPRRVYGWYGDLWKFPSVRLVRIEPSVLVILANSAETFTRSDLIEPTNETRRKRDEAHLKEVTAEMKKFESKNRRDEKRKEKRALLPAKLRKQRGPDPLIAAPIKRRRRNYESTPYGKLEKVTMAKEDIENLTTLPEFTDLDAPILAVSAK